MILQQRSRQSLRFAAENQHVAGDETYFGIRTAGRFGEEVRLASRQPGYQGGPVVDDLPFQVLPVIEAGPAR